MCIYVFNCLDKLNNINKLHSLKVGDLVKRFTKSLNIYDNDLFIGALLHDIGKLYIPDSILTKPSSLTEEEFNIIKLHPEYGIKFIKGTSYEHNKTINNCIKYHHLKYNGNGSYPQCDLKYDNIPLEARIVSICDAFDAMTSDRGYNKVISKEDALKQLVLGKNTKYDPDIVDKFVAFNN